MATTTNLGPCDCCSLCCPDTNPPYDDPTTATLTATFTGGVTGTITLTWNGSFPYWDGFATLSCGGATLMNVNLNEVLPGRFCPDFALASGAGGCSTGGAVAFDSVQCDPFVAVRHFPTGTSGGCCAGIDFTVTVTL